ncbi:hypothetical protein [Kocuria nitroreducens]|uniref:hypothetical protein n=1 Tax=Kocuria nitroreducens TaxID=3058914 RepID=UPI0036DDBCC1
MIIGSFAVVFVIFFVTIIATLARAPIATRIAGAPEDIPVVSTRLSVTLFHVAMLTMSLLLMIAVGTQVLYGVTDTQTVVVPAVGAAFFAYAYVLARYFSRYSGRLSYRQWVGGADGETAELFAQAYRERAWIVGLAIIPPLLVLVARVLAVGALGTPADLPAGADWS